MTLQVKAEPETLDLDICQLAMFKLIHKVSRKITKALKKFPWKIF